MDVIRTASSQKYRIVPRYYKNNEVLFRTHENGLAVRNIYSFDLEDGER